MERARKEEKVKEEPVDKPQPSPGEEELPEADKTLDVVEEEGMESFPASDAPASGSFTGAEDIEEEKGPE